MKIYFKFRYLIIINWVKKWSNYRKLDQRIIINHFLIKIFGNIFFNNDMTYNDLKHVTGGP